MTQGHRAHECDSSHSLGSRAAFFQAREIDHERLRQLPAGNPRKGSNERARHRPRTRQNFRRKGLNTRVRMCLDTAADKHSPKPTTTTTIVTTCFFFSHQATRVLGLGLLYLVSEEFVRPDSPLPDVRKKELRASLVWAMPSILQVLAEVRRCGFAPALGALWEDGPEKKGAKKSL